MYKDVSQAANVTVAVTLVWLGLSLGYFFNRLDQRVVLTYSQRFSDYTRIREVFRNRTNYTAQFNPPGLSHVQFPASPETLEDLEDMQRRGLIAGFNYTASSGAADPSMLRELMVRSWCSSYPGLPGVLPAQRTPGCRCISSAYVLLVMETRPTNATNDTIVQARLVLCLC